MGWLCSLSNFSELNLIIKINLNCFGPFCFNSFKLKNTKPLLVMENMYYSSTLRKLWGYFHYLNRSYTYKVFFFWPNNVSSNKKERFGKQTNNGKFCNLSYPWWSSEISAEAFPGKQKRGLTEHRTLCRHWKARY